MSFYTHELAQDIASLGLSIEDALAQDILTEYEAETLASHAREKSTRARMAEE